jgi:hypothetical protein
MSALAAAAAAARSGGLCGGRARRLRRRGRRWAAASGLVVVAGLAAGCTTARSDLGTSDSACYRAIPAATRAVNGQGRLLGVQRASLGSLHGMSPELLRDISAGQSPTQAVCVIAFQGHYTSASVLDPRGRSSGRLAVVVTTTPADHLLGTVVFSHPPFHFGRSHAG